MKTFSFLRAIRFGRRGKAVIVIGLLMTAFVVAGSILMLWRTRATEIAEWKANLEHSSIMIAEHTRQSMKAADLVLKSIIEDVQEAGIEDEADLRRVLGTQDVFDMMRNKASSLPQIDVATIVDIDGRVINFTRSFPPPPINLADRDYFKAHMADPKLDLFLSVPVRNRGTGTWTFYLARKIKSRTGATLGLVLTGLEVNFFESFFKAVNISSASAISLFRSDGILLARYPLNPELLGKSFAEQAVFRDVIGRGNSSGAVVTTSPRLADGKSEMRIVAPRTIPDYPMVINITATDALILALWRSTALFVGVGATIVTLLLLGLTAWIAILLTRQEMTLRELRRARRDAEQAADAKAEFLAMMSHEIRTPMNSVIGLTSLLADSDMDPAQKRSIRVIEKSANHLLTIINDILDFSRLEAGRLDLEKSAFDLRELCDSAIMITRSLPGARALDIAADISPVLPAFLTGDAGHINQILLNLLSNAVKYTEHGSVRLRVSQLGRLDPVCRLRFEVIDTGTGIAPEICARLFQPFEQGDPRLARRKGGTGLGLAICRRIVELMGGRIGVDSRPGHGSTFWFELALEQAPAEQLQPQAEDAARPMQRPLRILVAEDTPANQVVVRAMLEQLGHRVQVVSDGDEAVTAAAARAFDLILMDVQMPLVDGYEAARRIRALPGQSAQAPIVALTAFAQPTDRERALAAGMTEYLRKPIRMRELATMIERLVPAAVDEGERAPALDAAALADLRAAVGVDTFHRLVGHCLHDGAALVAEIEAAQATGDQRRLRSAAHRLSGLFPQFGAERAGAAALALEIEAGGAVAERTATLLAEARAALAALAALAETHAQEVAP
ncbi:Hpt sensor hybrid histidine kinase [Enhydrobacter aerosaccus]|uniref:Sensory/regulatory protein RpfC n=1 Tax=Enhydrobacter aerosaccus TaxID=225324 RepID=A0A1T4PG11_9HYPH|nr:hybrid sensor histidine kinase/response regulator [Enhydrobacter aerosaccus]SJZ90495.1 Hpt sensor hybrid histidine kinase [Enhydrobacter aerosaccus]